LLAYARLQLTCHNAGLGNRIFICSVPFWMLAILPWNAARPCQPILAYILFATVERRDCSISRYSGILWTTRHSSPFRLDALHVSVSFQNRLHGGKIFLTFVDASQAETLAAFSCNRARPGQAVLSCISLAILEAQIYSISMASGILWYTRHSSPVRLVVPLVSVSFQNLLYGDKIFLVSVDSLRSGALATLSLDLVRQHPMA